MGKEIKCMITGRSEPLTNVVYKTGEQNKPIFNSINNKKSCFVDEKDIDEIVTRNRLGKYWILFGKHIKLFNIIEFKIIIMI